MQNPSIYVIIYPSNKKWKVCYDRKLQVAYNKLWKKLIDLEMSRTQMRLKAGISTKQLAKLGKNEKQLEMAREVYDTRLRVHGEGHPLAIEALDALATAYGESGDHKKEIELHEKVYEAYLSLYGEEHPYTLTVLTNCAVAYYEDGDKERAIDTMTRALEISIKMNGEEHQMTVQIYAVIEYFRSH